MAIEVIEKTSDLDSRAAAAKQSEDEMERLINDFRPFLHSRAARYALKGDEFQREELFSTAMLSFHKAVQSYDCEKGHFFPFVNNVLRFDLIDHVRKFYRSGEKTQPLDEYSDENHSSAIYEASMRVYEETSRRERLVEEIEQFKSELAAWGITLESLVRQSPKHKKLAETYKSAVAQILQSPDIIHTIQLKRYCPINAISKITGIPTKKLERARTFIIASLIIKMGDYELLSDYVS